MIDTLTVLKNVSLQMHEVHDAMKRRPIADGHLGGGDHLAIAGPDRVNKAEIVGVLLVHLVDEDGAGQTVTLGVFPGGIETDIGTAAVLGGDHEQGRLDHFQCRRDFTQEIRVAGGINEVDVDPIPFTGGKRGMDACLAPDFFRIKVADSRPVFDTPLALDGAGDVEERFGEGGLPCAAVSDKCNIAYGVCGVPAHHPLQFCPEICPGC